MFPRSIHIYTRGMLNKLRPSKSNGLKTLYKRCRSNSVFRRSWTICVSFRVRQGAVQSPFTGSYVTESLYCILSHLKEFDTCRFGDGSAWVYSICFSVQFRKIFPFWWRMCAWEKILKKYSPYSIFGLHTSIRIPRVVRRCDDQQRLRVRTSFDDVLNSRFWMARVNTTVLQRLTVRVLEKRKLLYCTVIVFESTGNMRQQWSTHAANNIVSFFSKNELHV